MIIFAAGDRTRSFWKKEIYLQAAMNSPSPSAVWWCQWWTDYRVNLWRCSQDAHFQAGTKNWLKTEYVKNLMYPNFFLHVITLIWSKGAEFKGKLFNLFSNLLNAQAQVVDAVGFIRLAVRPADLLDETTQTKTEICRSALQQIHLHSHGALWIRHSGRRKSC